MCLGAHAPLPWATVPPFAALCNCCVLLCLRPQELSTFSPVVAEGTGLGAAVVGRGALQWFGINKGTLECLPLSLLKMPSSTTQAGEPDSDWSQRDSLHFCRLPFPHLSLINGFLDQVSVKGRHGKLSPNL